MSIRDNFKISQFNYEKKYRPFALISCPFFLMRRNLYKYIKHYAPLLTGKVLDFGCGSKPYRHLFTSCSEYIGIDIDGGHDHEGEDVDVIYDGVNIPFSDETFDSAFSSEVIEHIDNVDKSLSEINRVLKPGGLFLLTVPFVWNENELPFDYARYTSVGLKKLLNRNGFKVVKYCKSSSYTEMLYQMRAEYYRGLADRGSSDAVKRIVQLLLIMPNSVKGMLFGRALPKDWSYFGNNIVLCEKKS